MQKYSVGVRRAGALVIAAAAALVLGLVPSGGAFAAPKGNEARCEVGGAPAWHFMRVPPGVKQLSPAITIACGSRLAGAFEIVAFDTSEGLWVYADSGPIGYSEGQPVLDPALSELSGVTITAAFGWGAPPSRSHLFGVLSANVARVELIFHHRGQHRRLVRTPTLARVDDGKLLADLHQTEPFGAYAITLPGCVPPKGIRVVAFDSQGHRLGTAKPFNGLAHPCNPKTWFPDH